MKGQTKGRRTLIAVGLIALVAFVGWRWLGSGGSKDKEPARAAKQPAVPAWQYRDGKLQRIDPGKVAGALRKLRRAAGLIRVTGVVRERHTANPIASAEVVFASPVGEATATAGADGHYSIDVAPGFYRAFARAAGYVPVSAELLQRVPEPPDLGKLGMPRSGLAPLIGLFQDRNGVDMELAGGGIIRGTVYDQSGAPISGAVVSAKQISGSALRSLAGTDVHETDLDGSFEIEVPAGYLQLEANHAEFAGLARGAQNRLYLRAGETATVNLTLIDGCVITGRVVTSRGDPVGEGTLEERVGGVPPNDWAPVGKLDASGRFRLARTDEKDLELRAWPWKSGPTETRQVRCHDGARHEDLVLVTRDTAADLEGVIVAENGTRMPDAYIDIFPLFAGGMEQQERADGVGEWAFHNLPPGDYHVTAYVPGYGAVAETVTVPSTNIRLRLSGTGNLRGRVRGIEHGSFTLLIERCTLETEGRAARFDETSMPPQRVIVPVERGEFRVERLPACPIRGWAMHRGRRVFVQARIPAGGEASTEIDLR